MLESWFWKNSYLGIIIAYLGIIIAENLLYHVLISEHIGGLQEHQEMIVKHQLNL